MTEWLIVLSHQGVSSSSRFGYDPDQQHPSVGTRVARRSALRLLNPHHGVHVTSLADDSFAPFFALSTDYLLIIDEGLEVLRSNPAFERSHGTPTCPAEGRSILEFVAPRDRKRVEEVLRSLSAGTSKALDASLVQRTQMIRTCEWSVAVDPGTRHRFVVIRDVTTRRRLEQELRNSQKLEAVGQLASGIAHEINTPIQFVGNNLTFLAEISHELLEVINALAPHAAPPLETQFPDFELDFVTAELPKAIEQSCEGIQRVAELVRGMKEFAHRDQGVLAPTDVNEAVEKTLIVSRNEWKYVADVEKKLGKLPLVPCLAGGVRQVLLNLVCNAAQAIDERNRKTCRQRGHINITTSFDDTFVTIAVTDDGQGMPATVKARMFEPFFTTKPVGKGTGQGLALSRNIIVEKHGGELTFESQEGVGTTFFVRLPIIARAHGQE